MKTSSAKQKGRKFQQWVRDCILEHNTHLTLDDVRSTSMGAGGEDIQLSPKAREAVPFSIECKNTEKISLYPSYAQACENAPKDSEPVLFIKKNHHKPLAVVDAEFLISLISAYKPWVEEVEDE